jgi:hypothetical protein
LRCTNVDFNAVPATAKPENINPTDAQSSMITIFLIAAHAGLTCVATYFVH